MADVNNAPAGGFQEGGWYWDPSINEARQYSGGSFGAGTTINNPNQKGYGERVSEETQAQSGFVSRNRGSSVNSIDSSSSSGRTRNASSLDLLKEYDNLAESLDIDSYKSDIESKEESLTQLKESRDEAEAMENENPFLAEATRVGKIRRLNESFNDEASTKSQEIANAEAKLAGAYNTLNSRLGLITTQYDIDQSSQARAYSEFNDYLALGMLDGAGGTEIEDISFSTGIPINLIQNAISNRQKQIASASVSSGSGFNPEAFLGGLTGTQEVQEIESEYIEDDSLLRGLY